MSKPDAAMKEELRRCGEALAALQESERAARAEAERANRLRDEFVSTLSHELRNPLSAISGWAEVLRLRLKDDPGTADALRAIERAVHKQNRMITDLLDISGLLSGKSPLRTARVDARAVSSLAIDAMGQAIRDKRIQVSLEAPAQALWLTADAERLQQLLCLLLDNAVRFSPEGSRVQVTLEQAHGQLAISISDSGPGIDPGLLPRLFDRFRPDQSRPHQRSSGFGLAMVRILVELHGGAVEAHSPAGAGACFRLLLPLPAAAAVPSHFPQAASAP